MSQIPFVTLVDYDATIAETVIEASTTMANLLFEHFGEQRVIDAFHPDQLMNREAFVIHHAATWAGLAFETVIRDCVTRLDIEVDEDLWRLVDAELKSPRAVSPRAVQGIVPVLRGLRQNGDLLIGVTSSPYERVIPGLESTGTSSFFMPTPNGMTPPQDARVCGSVFDKTGTQLEAYPLNHLFWSAVGLGVRGKSKQSPQVFLRVIRDISEHFDARSDVVTRRCVAIEDSISGIEAACAAGIRVIGWSAAEHLYDKRSAEKRMLRAGAFAATSRPNELLATIQTVRQSLNEGRSVLERGQTR